MVDKQHEGLPVHGYRPQSDEHVQMVNRNKQLEETLLRLMDSMKTAGQEFDQRWLAIARTKMEEAFMALNRAIFQPDRVELHGGTQFLPEEQSGKLAAAKVTDTTIQS